MLFTVGILAATAGLAAAGTTLVLGPVREATSAPPESFSAAGVDGDHIEVVVDVLDVSPVSSTLDAQVWVIPHGKYAATDESLAREIDLQTNTSSAQVLTFAPGLLYETKNQTIALEGDATKYPFDAYESTFSASAVAEGSDVPIVMTVRDMSHSWSTVAVLQSAATSAVTVEFTATRSPAVIAFALFQLLIIIALAAIVAIVTLLHVTSHLAPEFGLLGWFAALMFALPAIRNTLPGTPSVGVDADFYVYFWALFIVAGCTIITAVRWTSSKFAAERTAENAQAKT
ncbi:hypothetical protein ABMA10_19495 [Plantibacter sp. RU18]